MLIFSKTSEYAIRILSYFSIHEGETLSASFLHKELGIPYKYLTRLITTLSKAGFLEPIKGRSGGFTMIKRPEDIYINEIVQAVEGSVDYEGCIMGFSSCDSKNPCLLHQKWIDIRGEIKKLLKSTNLKEFKERQNPKI